jgi:hypothetical protein
MKSKSAKGNDFQDWCAALLLELFPGSAIHNQKAVAKAIPIKDPKTGKIEVRWVSQRNDIFGCIDLIWIHGESVTWIQCTMDQGVTRKAKDLGTVAWPDSANVELWVKRGPGKVSIFRYWGGGVVPIARIEKRKVLYF